MSPVSHLVLAAFLASMVPLVAQPTPSEATAPTPAQLQRVMEFLRSPQANLRAGAYKGCRARGDAFKADYFEMLERAYQHHGNEVARVIRGVMGPGTPQGDLVANWKQWQKAAGTAVEFVLINHEKDQVKHHEMDRLFADAQRAWTRLAAAKRNVAKLGADATAKLEASLSALREIHKEKAWCRPDEFDAEDTPDLADFEKDLSLGSDATDHLRALAEINTTLQALEDAHAHNDQQKWAGPAHRGFARILNERRAALGLRPLRLEEKLSDACAAHSKEMTALGYFAHESPVEENKTFGMRADKAGFQGSAMGECIFSGNADPVEAEKAWWYSDGHRLINYHRDPDTLGLGPVGTMWTLNIATYPW